MLRTPSEFEQAYLGSDDPRAQSGFNGTAERWEAARRPIVAPGLVELARRRLPQWADRVWLADVRSWALPFRFDFVHARLELGAIDEVLQLGRRVIFSSDGSFRRPDSPKAEPVAERLREVGLSVSGELYRRSNEQLVEVAVTWVDQE